MKIHSMLNPGKEGIPIRDLITWLNGQLAQGFSEQARVRCGKTTGQKPVIIIDEERKVDSTAPDQPFVRRTMWPDIAENS
jgi:hypothetical protein